MVSPNWTCQKPIDEGQVLYADVSFEVEEIHSKMSNNLYPLE